MGNNNNKKIFIDDVNPDDIEITEEYISYHINIKMICRLSYAKGLIMNEIKELVKRAKERGEKVRIGWHGSEIMMIGSLNYILINDDIKDYDILLRSKL